MDLVQSRSLGRCLRQLQPWFEQTGTIDDSDKATAQHIEDRPNSGQKEYGSNGDLNKVRDLIYWIHKSPCLLGVADSAAISRLCSPATDINFHVVHVDTLAHLFTRPHL